MRIFSVRANHSSTAHVNETPDLNAPWPVEKTDVVLLSDAVLGLVGTDEDSCRQEGTLPGPRSKDCICARSGGLASRGV